MQLHPVNVQFSNQVSWAIYTSGRCRCRCLGHLHLTTVLLLRKFFIWFLQKEKRERKPKYTRESEKGKHPCCGAVGRRQLFERDDAHEKSLQKAAPATHFCSDILVDNAQQRSEALSMSTTLATAPEILEPVSLAVFTKKKRCRCYM